MLIAELNLVEEIFEDVFGDEFPELLQLFKKHGEYCSYQKGDFIYREKAPTVGFYWILNGCAKVCQCHKQENEQIITLLGRGDFGGITATMNRKPYSKSCIAVDDNTIALLVPHEAFYEWFAKYPVITLPLMRMVEDKIDRIENRATNFISKNIEQRLAGALLLVEKKFGYDAEDFLNTTLSPQEYASIIGTTRTTIYRIFKKLEDAGIIKIDHKRIRLIEKEMLEVIS